MKYWHDISEVIPCPGVPVLFACETWLANRQEPERYIVMGIVAEEKTIVCGDDFERAEYDEDSDEYYLPAGYYEKTVNWREYEYSEITDEVTHWRTLPGLPKKQNEEVQ